MSPTAGAENASRSGIALIVAAGGALLTDLITHDVATSLTILLVGLIVGWATQLGLWRSLLAFTLLLFECATFGNDTISSLAYYPRYVAGIALVACTLSQGRGRSLRLGDLSPQLRRLIYSLWWLCGVAISSTVWSIDPMTTFQQAIILINLVLLLHLTATKRWLNRETMVGDYSVIVHVLTATFAGGVFLAVVGPAQAFAGERMTGLFANPNTLGILSALTLPLAWGLYRETRSIWIIPLLAVTAVSLLLSQSRTALAATIVALLVMAARGGVGKAIQFTLTLGIVGVVTFGVVPILGLPGAESVASRFNAMGSDESIRQRAYVWSATVGMWREEPVLGYGFRSGEELFEQLRETDQLEFTPNMAHGSYIQALLELGIVGTIPILFAAAVLVYIFLRGRARGLSIGLLGGVVAGITVSITESAMFGTGAAFPWVFWLVAIGACFPQADKENTNNPGVGSDPRCQRDRERQRRSQLVSAQL